MTDNYGLNISKLPKACHFIDFQDLSDSRGGLVSIERIVPFEIKRIYYLYSTPQNQIRGLHAHKKLEQIIIPIHGSFQLMIEDGHDRITIRMDAPNKGLYICPMIWREISCFSEDAVCLVLASECYDEEDYIRDYEEFRDATKS